jgi:hypothetical protein
VATFTALLPGGGDLINTPAEAHFEIDSGMLLMAPGGGPVDPDRVERIAHMLMEAMLDVESESLGQVHSTAVSVSGTGNVLLESGVTCVGNVLEVEFAVDATSVDEASEIAQGVLRELVHKRLAQHLRPAPEFEEVLLLETKRDLEMVS